MRTTNPVLSERTYERYAAAGEASSVMTVQGTVHKTLLLVGIVMIPAFWIWSEFLKASRDFSVVVPWMFGGLIGGAILCLVLCFKAQWAPFLAPLYAGCEGLFLGGLSSFVETRFPGIVLQSVALTMGIFLSMLLLYTSRTIRATPKLTAGIMIATGGVMIVYLISMVLRMFGTSMPYIHDGGAIGIGFSLLVIGIAAFNFVLDFDLIERGAADRAPKFMEWYGGFALLVTLVWLYVEVLRLLMKLRGRD